MMLHHGTVVLEHGSEGAGAVPDGPRPLGLGSDEEAGDVDEMHHGNVEGLGELGEAGHLEGGVRRPRPAVEVGVSRDDRDGPPIQPGEPGDEGTPPRLADLEERAAVHHCLDDRAHAVDLAAVARDRPDEPFLAPRRVVVGRAARGQLVHRPGQVGEEAGGVGERFRLGIDHRVDRADAGVHVGAAEFLLVDRLSDPGHHRRPRHEHLRGAPHQHRVVARHEPRGPEPRDRAEPEADDGNRREVRDRVLPADCLAHVGAALGLDGLDRAAAPRAVHEPDEGKPQLARHLLRRDHLVPDGGVRRAASDREVVAFDHHPAAVEIAPAVDEVRGPKAGEAAFLVVGGDPGDRADLVERAGVEEPVHPFADRELALAVMARDLLRAAHLADELLTPAKLLELGLPAPRHALAAPAFG